MNLARRVERAAEAADLEYELLLEDFHDLVDRLEELHEGSAGLTESHRRGRRLYQALKKVRDDLPGPDLMIGTREPAAGNGEGVDQELVDRLREEAEELTAEAAEIREELEDTEAAT